MKRRQWGGLFLSWALILISSGALAGLETGGAGVAAIPGSAPSLSQESGPAGPGLSPPVVRDGDQVESGPDLSVGVAVLETPAGAALEGFSLDQIQSSGLDDYTRQVALTLSEAVTYAHQHNPELANSRRDVRLAELEITRSMAAYDPYVQADASYSKSQKPSSQAVFGTSSESASVTLSTGITTITGGSLSLDFRNTRSESDSIFSTLNPSYNTDLTLNVRQPLLKNRFDDTRSMDLSIKNNDYERALISLEQKGLELTSQVEDAYWSLFRSLLDLEQKRNSLDLALRMDETTRAQVRAGVAPAVSTLQTEANLASARAALIRSENEYRKSQNNLKIALNLMDEQVFSLELIPRDLPRYSPPDFDREAFLAEAMANNFTLRQSLLAIANNRINLVQAQNRALPQLDFRASVGVSGLAGTSNPMDQVMDTGFVIPNPLPSEQFPQPYMIERVVVPGRPGQYEGDYLDALDNMLSGENMSWSAGVTYRQPVGNRAATADYERARISHEKQLEDYRYQERQTFLNLIGLLYDVEAAHRNLVASHEARRLQKNNLEAEERKYALGLNTSYEVMQAEQNFNEARSAEIGSLIEYAKVMGRLERARQGHLGVGFALSMPIGLPAGISMDSLPAGIDPGLIQQYSGMLPAGVDINTIMQFLP